MKIEKTECSYQVTECDLKFGEQITLDGELLIPISVLDKIKTDVKKLPITDTAIRLVTKVIDKYKAER